jgi:hypothetical protein
MTRNRTPPRVADKPSSCSPAVVMKSGFIERNAPSPIAEERAGSVSPAACRVTLPVAGAVRGGVRSSETATTVSTFIASAGAIRVRVCRLVRCAVSTNCRRTRGPLSQGGCRRALKENDDLRWAGNRNGRGVFDGAEGIGDRKDAAAAQHAASATFAGRGHLGRDCHYGGWRRGREGSSCLMRT